MFADMCSFIELDFLAYVTLQLWFNAALVQLLVALGANARVEHGEDSQSTQ